MFLLCQIYLLLPYQIQLYHSFYADLKSNFLSELSSDQQQKLLQYLVSSNFLLSCFLFTLFGKELSVLLVWTFDFLIRLFLMGMVLVSSWVSSWMACMWSTTVRSTIRLSSCRFSSRFLLTLKPLSTIAWAWEV